MKRPDADKILQIYEDFLELLECQKKGIAVDYPVLHRLLTGLPAVVEEVRHPNFMETVAIETISATVAKAVAAMGQKGDVSLPDFNVSYFLRQC
jgi:nuclear pore complex protein Nup98-Nup96